MAKPTAQDGQMEPMPELSVRPISELRLAAARELYSFYSGLCRDGRIPDRDQIDPLTIPRHLLPSVYLLEPVGEMEDFRYRLIGSEIVEKFRTDRTGQSLREIIPEEKACSLIEVTAEIARSGEARFFQLIPENTAMDYFYTETMSLPIRPKGSGHNWIFGGTFFGSAKQFFERK